MNMREQNGFTLVEMLVSVALLAVIMVALGGALRTVAQTEERVDQRLDRSDDVRTSVALLRQMVGRVSARKIPAPAGSNGELVQFRALPTAMEWVGIMPARPGAGGRYFFRLQVEQIAGAHELVLRFAPWTESQAAVTDWSSTDYRILGRKIKQLFVQAQGRPAAGTPMPNWPQGWVPGWPVVDQLPERIQLEIADERGTWPPLIIPIFGLTQGAGVGGGFSIGGGS
jgi:general secretion pathway protein J